MNWKEKLYEHMSNESHDHEEYLEMAHDAEMTGHTHEAGILRDIAHDEKTHQDMINFILSKNVVKNP